MKKLAWLFLLVAICLSVARPARADSLYVVQRGDTLYRIASRFGVTVSALIAANSLVNPNVIYAGQVLLIPGPEGTTPPPAVLPSQYVVQAGDTLWRIARRFGISVQAVMAANNLIGTRIYAGQVLLIPSLPASGMPAPTPPPPAATPAPLPSAAPCANGWFFNNPPAGSCPAAAQLDTQAAVERFERGLMLWLSQTDTFYVFHHSPPQSAAPLTVAVGPLRIKAGGSVDHRVGGVPAGLFEPVSGFGLLWRGEAEQYPPALRPALGWALEAEHSIETTLQCEAYPGTSYPSPSCYLRGPAGEILHIYYVRYFGYYWERWPSPE